MSTSNLRTAIAATVGSAFFVIAGCETTPKDNAQLASARSAVQSAQSNPDVTKYAPTELDRARKMLINAEGATKEHGANDKQAAHYAYLATQLAHIAEQRSQEQVAMAQLKQGEAQRKEVLLSARENEAQQALSQARDAQAAAEQARNEAANAQSEKQQLMAQLSDMQARQTNRGIVLTLGGDVLFDTGRAELKPGAERSIERIATFLSDHPERRVQVEGFTDSQGTDDYNLELSQKRADSVARAIMQRGVDAQRVRAMGYGEEFPKASNDNAGSRQLNRRVEIVVSNDNGAIPERTATGNP
jgi:outer membrane protein OmpA-like peptidoglycan-associated protein